MVNIDAWMFEFIKQNWFFLGTFFGVLKIFARETEWVIDDKIITFLSGRARLIKKESDKSIQ